MTLLSRPVFWTAIMAGVSYYLTPSLDLMGPLAVVWEGAGVALLALWCAMRARSFDGWLIAGAMAFGALGDVLLETWGLITAAVAFIMGHVLAMGLYFRNWRPRLTSSQRLLATLVVPLSVSIAMMVVPPEDRVSIGFYTFFVGGMAASAWASRFPRYGVGIGAMLFLASDLLIFARMGALVESPLPGRLIWPLYFAGQALIASGVVRTLSTADIGKRP